MSGDDLFNLLLRGTAAAAWLFVLWRRPSAAMRRTGTACLAVLLVTVTVGPFLVAPFGPWFVRTLYTAVAFGIAMAGVLVATADRLRERER